MIKLGFAIFLIATCTATAVNASEDTDILFQANDKNGVCTLGPNLPEEEFLAPYFHELEQKISTSGFDAKTFGELDVTCIIRIPEKNARETCPAITHGSLLVKFCNRTGGEKAALSLLKKASPLPAPPEVGSCSRGILIRLKYPKVTVSQVPRVSMLNHLNVR